MRQIAILEWGPVSLCQRRPKERLHLKSRFKRGGPFLPLFSSDTTYNHTHTTPCVSAASVDADKEATCSAEHVALHETAASGQVNVYKCSVRYALSAHSKLDAAIRNLRLAFGYGFPEAVGYVNVKARKHRCSSEHVQFLQTMESWAIMKNVDAVIWIDYESLASKIKMVGLADSLEMQQQLVRDAFEGARRWRRPLLPEQVKQRRLRQAKITEMTSWTTRTRTSVIQRVPGTKLMKLQKAGKLDISNNTFNKSGGSSREVVGPAEEGFGMRSTRTRGAERYDSGASFDFGKASALLGTPHWEMESLSKNYFLTGKKISAGRDGNLPFRTSSTSSSFRRIGRFNSLKSASRCVSRRSTVLARLLRDAQRRRTALQKLLNERRLSDSTTDISICDNGGTVSVCTATASPRRNTALTKAPVAAELTKPGKVIRKVSHALSSNALPLSYKDYQRAIVFPAWRRKDLREVDVGQRKAIHSGDTSSVSKQEVEQLLRNTQQQEQASSPRWSVSPSRGESHMAGPGEQWACTASADQKVTTCPTGPQRQKTTRESSLCFRDVQWRMNELLGCATEQEQESWDYADYLETAQPEVVGGVSADAYHMLGTFAGAWVNSGLHSHKVTFRDLSF